jgi:hypothetical protein
MIKLAVYVVEDLHDALTAERSDVFTFSTEGNECEACNMIIGPSLDEFFPAVIVVDTDEVLGRDSWAICLECATPLLYPHEWVINLDF